MQNHRVSRSLSSRVRKYIEHKLKTISDENAVVQFLSPALRGEMRLEECESYLNTNELFAEIAICYPPVMMKIALALKYSTLEPAEVLFKRGGFMSGCHIRIDGQFRTFSSKQSSSLIQQSYVIADATEKVEGDWYNL